jgi:hypothetical protein
MKRDRLLAVVSILLLATACSSERAGVAQQPAEVAMAPSMTPFQVDPSKPDFDLGENLTYEELKAISDRVLAEKAHRGLSDMAALELSNREIRKASIARWRQDHKTWIIRDESSPLFKK